MRKTPPPAVWALHLRVIRSSFRYEQAGVLPSKLETMVSHTVTGFPTGMPSLCCSRGQGAEVGGPLPFWVSAPRWGWTQRSQAQTPLPFASVGSLLSRRRAEKGICFFCPPTCSASEETTHHVNCCVSCFRSPETLSRWANSSALTHRLRIHVRCDSVPAYAPRGRDTMIKTILSSLQYLFATLRDWAQEPWWSIMFNSTRG